MSKLTHRLSTVPELGAVNLSVRNGKSAIQFWGLFRGTLPCRVNDTVVLHEKFSEGGAPSPMGSRANSSKSGD